MRGSYMKKLFAGLIFLFVSFGFAWGEKQKFSWDFSDCDINDILYAISLDSGVSIVADDTVKGRGSFRFVGSDFEVAFEKLLLACRLYAYKNEQVWIVSKCKIEVAENTLSLDAYDLTPFQIVEKLSSVLKSPITFDSLPSHVLNVHFKNLSEVELLEKLALCFSGYEVIKNQNGFHFAKKKSSSRDFDLTSSDIRFEIVGNNIFVDIKNALFSDVVNSFFDFVNGKVALGEAETNQIEKIKIKNFCIMANSENKIQRTSFNAKDFIEVINILCAQNGFECLVVDDIYYIVSNSRAKEQLLGEKRTWQKYKLDYLKAERFVSYVSKKLGQIEQIILPDDFSVLFLVTKKQDEEIKNLITDVDIKNETYLLTLKYITPQELLKFLPPNIDKNSISIADDNSCIYFKGTEQAYKNVCKEISLCDRPAQRISYDLLILQYDDSSENLWSSSIGVNKLSLGDRNNASVMLGSVMNFNLNVVSVFGLNFAANLQSSIEENKTRVYADTTLHGVSGKQINFQNTNTYRYRDNNIDPETGKPIYSGVTREIVSGIKIDILGRVSGNGMITSTVTASVTRQGLDTSSSTGNPPPTTEKIVTTEVCGKSGEAVVLSGLIQNAESEDEKRTPLLSKIPLLGNLFKNKNKLKQNSQMVIYLVPHLEMYSKPNDEDFELWAQQKLEAFLEQI